MHVKHCKLYYGRANGPAHFRRVLLSRCSAPRAILSKPFEDSFVGATLVVAKTSAWQLADAFTELGQIDGKQASGLLGVSSRTALIKVDEVSV